MAFGSNHNVVMTESSLSILNYFSVSSPPHSLSSATTNSPVCPTITSTNSFTTSTGPVNVMGTKPKKKMLPCNSSNGRVETVNSLLPSRGRPNCKHNADSFEIMPLADAAELNHRSWIVRHPSALTFFDRIMDTANGKQVAVFLDYDGTLSPIVKNPDCAYMSDKMRATVKDVALNFPTAIISGRCRNKVYDFVQLPELYYAGSHGMDIMGPATGGMAHGTRAFNSEGNEVILFQLSNDLTATIKDVCKELSERTKLVEGVRIDNNKFCASVHFRCVKEEDWYYLAEQVKAVVQFYPDLYLTKGRKVLEIRPRTAWDKGKAVEFLLESLGLGAHSNVFPIYIGDDRTDEDAFRVLNDKLGQGLSILVSSAPKETIALCSLRDPSEVMQFLRRLVDWRVNQSL